MGSQRADVRGRQWAYLIVFAPLTIILSVGFVWWSGYTWTWPWVAATVPALLGGGAGLIVYSSVFGMVPGPDAHKRPSNPLERADTTGQSQVLFWVGTLLTVPGLGLVFLGERLDQPWLMWAGTQVSLLTGIVVGYWLGKAAIRRLATGGPDMLHALRSGRTAVPRTAKAGEGMKTGSIVEGLCWAFGSVLLIPQGLVPLVSILAGIEVRSWFLAMYVSPRYGIPIALVGILGGMYLYARAVMIKINKRLGSAPGGQAPSEAA